MLLTYKNSACNPTTDGLSIIRLYFLMKIKTPRVMVIFISPYGLTLDSNDNLAVSLLRGGPFLILSRLREFQAASVYSRRKEVARLSPGHLSQVLRLVLSGSRWFCDYPCIHFICGQGNRVC